jgi:hypothetical protein
VAGTVAALKEVVRYVRYFDHSVLVAWWHKRRSRFLMADMILTPSRIDRQFGLQVTPPAPVLKTLPKIFGHTDKNVRAEGSALAHALYQYLGAGIEPWLNDLKPVQVKELKEAWEAMEKDGQGKGSLKPARMTRKQAREVEESAAAGEEDNTPAEEGALRLAVRLLQLMLVFRLGATGSSTICGSGRHHPEAPVKFPGRSCVVEVEGAEGSFR